MILKERNAHDWSQFEYRTEKAARKAMLRRMNKILLSELGKGHKVELIMHPEGGMLASRGCFDVQVCWALVK